MAVHRDDSERFRRLSILGRIGWWEADFSSRQYLCSEYVCKLLGLEGEYLSFEDFGKMIREDYRTRISREFLAIQNMEVYEQTFPIYSTEGVVWVYSRVGYKEHLPDGTLKAFGVLQRVEMPKEEAAKQALQRVNDLLYRQTSISHSLFRFLKDEDISAGIYDILKDILDFFRGGRVYIFQYDEKCRYQSCTYEVVAPGVAPEKEMLQGVQADSLPWWTSQIMAQKPVLLETLGQLPEHAYAEYEILARQNIKSLMVTPLVANDQVWGYMGIDLVDRTRMWTNEDYQWFSSLANVISICIELRKTKDEAVRERTFLSNLFRYMPLGYVRMSIVCDEKDNPYGYYVTDANSIFADFLGKPASTFIGKTASSFSREAAPRLEYLLDIVNTGTHKEMDMCFELTNKHCHVVIYSPEKNEVVALFLDTTDSVQTHLALDHSEKLFKNIFANIPAGGVKAYADAAARQAGVTRELTAQQKLVDGLQVKFDHAADRLDDVDTAAKRINGDLATAKDHAGKVAKELYKPTTAADAVASAVEQADQRIKKFSDRVKGLVKRVFIFTMITAALRSMKDWMGKVVQSNSEASAAVARLKGALLTLAQPILSVLIPAFTALVNILTRIVSAIAGMVSLLFGKTIGQAKDAAKNMYDEAEAMEALSDFLQKNL